MVRVRAPGACGELVQGTIDGKHFLITCPIDLFSEVEVIGKKTGNHQVGSKTLQAVEKTFAFLGVSPCDIEVKVTSQLLLGKGMASSSADVSAACQAAALSVGQSLTADEIADIALAIEPTDGIFYEGIMMFDHVHGVIRQPLGQAPPLTIAMFDVGGEVDTLSFNTRRDLTALNIQKEGEVKAALELVMAGINKGDCQLIGQGATMSALANQQLLPKPCLPKMLEISSYYGAMGINVAHSGTVMGVLFSPEHLEALTACVEEIRKACPQIYYMHTVNLIDGGLRHIEGDMV